MAKNWTDEEYEKTDAAYCYGLDKQRLGHRVTKAEIVEMAMRSTGRLQDYSVGRHMGNLTKARQELKLPTLACIGPEAHRPEKLIDFLKQKYF